MFDVGSRISPHVQNQEVSKAFAVNLPPYGKQYLEQRPSAGIWVAIGPGAWRFAKVRTFPVMVLPEDHEPSDYEWPSDGQPALIHERGGCNDERLQAMAKALLLAGAPSVVAIREGLLTEDDPRVFFDSVAKDVAA